MAEAQYDDGDDVCTIDIAPRGFNTYDNKNLRDRVIVEGENGEILIKNFDDIDISTMTIVTHLHGVIKDLNMIFFVLPVADNTTLRGITPSPGTITSIRWDSRVRGEDGGHFKNAAIIDIWTGTDKPKRVSTKLSSTKIQMCGTKSMEMGGEASVFITDHINEGLKFLEYVNSDISSFLEFGSWLIENSKGESIVNEYPTTLVGIITIYEQQNDHYVKWPTLESTPEKYREYLRLIMYRLSDIKYISQLLPILKFYTEIEPSRMADHTSVYKVYRSMVNYNYHLGFKVDRLTLATRLKELGGEDENGIPKISADYANTLRPHVKIGMSSDIPDDEFVVRRDKGNSEQTFLIYMSGNIMHSGQGGMAMSKCYYDLISIIATIKDEIVIN